MPAVDPPLVRVAEPRRVDGEQAEKGAADVARDERRAQHLAEVLQRGRHRTGEALDDDVVHKVRAGPPGQLHLRELQRLRGLLEQLVNLLPILRHLVQLHAHRGLVPQVEEERLPEALYRLGEFLPVRLGRRRALHVRDLRHLVVVVLVVLVVVHFRVH